jgi:tetratricopeptide (TPR) repeat protein
VPAAIEAYRAALAVDDASVAALERLEGIYRRKSSPELLDVLGRRAEVTLDRDEQLRIFEDVAASAARLGRWVRAIAARRKCAELESDAGRRARHLYEAGVIYRDELASFDEACECFERAVAGFRDDGGQPPPEVEEAHQRLVGRNRTRAQR